MPHATPTAAQQRRLRAVIKRLVIELAHLDACLDSGLQDGRIQTAADGLDRAIDGLNEYLDTHTVRAA